MLVFEKFGKHIFWCFDRDKIETGRKRLLASQERFGPMKLESATFCTYIPPTLSQSDCKASEIKYSLHTYFIGSTLYY
jgi:hypothetical protein